MDWSPAATFVSTKPFTRLVLTQSDAAKNHAGALAQLVLAEQPKSRAATVPVSPVISFAWKI